MNAAELLKLQHLAALGDAQAAHALRAEYERRDRTDIASLELERRFNLPTLAGLAIKADSERIITGYASTFETDPKRADAYGDIIAPGAFLEALARHASNERRIRFLYQHNQYQVAGRPEVLAEDTKGLWTEGYCSKTPTGDEVLTLAQDRAIDSFSIGFYIRGYELFDLPDGSWLRKLTKIDLWEYSAVTFPANVYARIDEVRAVKSAQLSAPQLPNNRDIERLFDDRLTQIYAGISLAQQLERIKL